MDVSAGLLEIVVKLAQLGGVGVGVVVLLFSFLLLWRNQTVDKQNATFRLRFLTLGTSFAILSLLISLAQFALGNSGGKGRMRVTFSPSFKSQNLPVPEMKLLAADTETSVTEDSAFDVSAGSILKITADELIKQARTVQQLKATVQNVGTVNSELLAALEPASMPNAPVSAGGEPSSEAVPQLIAPEKLFGLKNSQRKISLSVRTGDYAAAARTSTSAVTLVKEVARDRASE